MNTNKALKKCDSIFNPFIFKICILVMTLLTSVPFIHMYLGKYVKIFLLYGILSVIYLVFRKGIRTVFKDKPGVLLIAFCVCYGVTVLLNRSSNFSENASALLYMSVFFCLFFIFTLCLYGGAAGAGIFTTQYYGCGDNEGIRHSFRFKLIACFVVALIGCSIFFFGGEFLISQYLQGEGDPALAAETLRYCKEYVLIMLIGMLPFALTNAYAGTLRECGHPMVPMIAGFSAMAVNLVGNYILIFGHLGMPAMGVAGAALATVISRYVEFLIVAIWMHIHKKECPYAAGLYKSLYIPKKLLKSISSRGILIIVNEGGFALGLAMLNQSYSYCGLDVVPALSISTTFYNVVAVAFHSLGNTVGTITGQMLGANLPKEEIRRDNSRQIALSVASGVLFAIVSVLFSGAFPSIYNTTDSVRHLAQWMIIISGLAMPIQAYFFPVYFTLRSGGKTISAFAIDCGSLYLLSIPLAFICSRYTNLSVLTIFTLCQAMDIVKCILGYFLIKKDSWLQNLTV